MNITSKKSALFILGVTAIVLSRLMFVLFNDPEGPNLLVVIGAAALVYLLSLIAYTFTPSVAGSRKFLSAVFAKIIIVSVLYFFLR